MATLKDVAELAGVTVTTASRMMNDRGRVSDKTRSKIHKAMDHLDYHPNELARSLAKQTSGFIGLIVPSARNYFFSSVIEGVEKYSSQNGCKLLLCVSNLEARKEKEYFNMLLGNKVMGIILASHTQDLNTIINVNAPLITIDRQLSSSIPSACVDNLRGGLLAGEHLIAKGCKRLLYVSGSAYLDMDANKRYLGLHEACTRHGLDKPLSIDASEEQFISMEYESTVAELFSRYPQVDGILASNDVIAAQILQYCTKHGVAVPDQLKVVGYDDSGFAAHCNPKLTTIRQPIDDVCRYAVENLIKSSSGQTVPTSAVFPVTLVERETT